MTIMDNMARSLPQSKTVLSFGQMSVKPAEANSSVLNCIQERSNLRTFLHLRVARVSHHIIHIFDALPDNWRVNFRCKARVSFERQSTLMAFPLDHISISLEQALAGTPLARPRHAGRSTARIFPPTVSGSPLRKRFVGIQWIVADSRDFCTLMRSSRVPSSSAIVLHLFWSR